MAGKGSPSARSRSTPDRAATQSVVAAIEQAFGRVDVAVLNAGTHVLGTKKPFDAQQFIDNMHLNYVGMLYGIEAVLPGMLSRGRGHIAGVSSLAGLRALPTAGGYGASKAAASHVLDAIRSTGAARRARTTSARLREEPLPSHR